MKKILFLVLAMAVAFSCQKKELETPNADVEVVFGIQKVDPNDGLKSTPPPICPTDGNGNLLVPDHASIWISVGTDPAIEYTPTVFELNGMLYTQAIKFASADGASVTYTVEDFVLYSGTTPIMATPAAAGDYAEYTTIHVPFTFEVNAFEKMEVPVEVLCYLPELYEYFGFTWFEITEIVVREFCFFGDICLNGYPFTPADFDGSLYGSGLGVDVPAIMKIVVKRDGVLVPNNDLFNNESTLGIGAPLCVQYPDRLNVPGEVFTFEVYLWLPDASGFSYQLYATYTSTDDGDLDIDDGGDGVVDFVVGSCGYDDQADVTFGFLYPVFVLTVESVWNTAHKNDVPIYQPYFNYEIDGLEITFELVNPRGFTTYFDYQVDGETGTLIPGIIGSGPLAGQPFGEYYNSTPVPANTTSTIVVSGTSEIRIGIHFGPEQDDYIDWAVFTAN